MRDVVGVSAVFTGVAVLTAEDEVAIVTEVVGHRVGVFQLVDLIGRDVRCAQHRHRHDPDFSDVGHAWILSTI